MAKDKADSDKRGWFARWRERRATANNAPAKSRIECTRNARGAAGDIDRLRLAVRKARSRPNNRRAAPAPVVLAAD